MDLRKTAVVASFVLFFLSASSVSAQDFKIGVVNAARVLEEAPQMEVARKALENEFAPRDEELVELQKQLRNMEEKLSRDGTIMSDVERRKMEREIRSRKRELKRLQDEFNEDLNIRRNEAFDRIRRKVLEVVNAIGEKEKFDLIVNDGVLYASDRVNITNAVIKQLKEEQKNTAANAKK
jgi:outer membrane protein